MNTKLDADMRQDEPAVVRAHVMAAANKRELSVAVRQSIVTITQMTDGEPRLCINYGPKDYLGRRGGDLIIDVDPSDASVKQVLHGQ